MGNNCSWRPSKRNIGQLLILAGSGLHAAGNAILKYLRKYKGTSFWFVIFVRGLLTIVFNLLLVLGTRGKRRVVETVLGEVRITCANASRGAGADMSYCVCVCVCVCVVFLLLLRASCHSPFPFLLRPGRADQRRQSRTQKTALAQGIARRLWPWHVLCCRGVDTYPRFHK